MSLIMITPTIHGSPWGPTQHQQDYGEGISSVSTSSHGGFFAARELPSRRIPSSLGRGVSTAAFVLERGR